MRRKNNKVKILKLSRDNEKKEIEFEISYQLSLTTEERFKMLFEKSRIIKEILLKNGYRRTFEIIKRT